MSMKLLFSLKTSVSTLIQVFAFSLIPIALVYNISHYYTLLVIQGQAIIPLVSDPFHMGWNLFGTLQYVPNIKIVDARFVWNSEVFFILVGHIIAVFIAHIVSIQLYKKSKKAVLSQVPLLILMVFYTVFGLWILSQPITTG